MTILREWSQDTGCRILDNLELLDGKMSKILLTEVVLQDGNT